MAVRTTRTGVGLIIGIIVFALLVLGGLYLVKERGEQARREEAVKIAQQNLEEQSNKTEALNPGDAQEGTEGEAGSGSGELSPTGTAPELPQTGPEHTLQVVGAGVLVFAVASYLASRRASA